jgi:predicted PurR-regulated permease PerM
MRAVLALLLSIGVLALVALFLVLLVGNSLTTLVNTLADYQGTFSQRRNELEAIAGDMGQTSVFQLLLSALDPATLVNIVAFIVGMVVSLFKYSALILGVTVFTLAEGPQFKSRMIKAFGADHSLSRNTITLLEMIISYFSLRALVNLIVAVSTAIMLWLFGIEYAGLWGVLIFFLSFIPYVGAFVSGIPPVLLAYAQGGLGLAIVIILLMIVINSLTENLVAPLVMGKGLSVSPTVVFLSFVFWINILGGLGAFIAMPLTIAAILFMSEFEETRGVAAIMGTFPEVAVQPQLHGEIISRRRRTLRRRIDQDIW